MLQDIMAAIYRSLPVLQESGGQGPDCRRSAGAGATSPLLPNGRHASTSRDSAHYRRQADFSFLVHSSGLERGDKAADKIVRVGKVFRTVRPDLLCSHTALASARLSRPEFCLAEASDRIRFASGAAAELRLLRSGTTRYRADRKST